MVSHRSTKGASKARRDHINHEIRNMRALLPISQEDQERLSYLHSMAAICTYIRKSLLFQGLPSGGTAPRSLPGEAFLAALHGFLLVTTADGRLVYVSENVDEHLGFSMLDLLQGDTVYDLVERADVDAVRAHLDVGSSSSSERSFVCCMRTSKAFRLQHGGGGGCSTLVRGRFQLLPPSSAWPRGELLFVALCTPTVDRLSGAAALPCSGFSSSHRLDMRFTHLSRSASFFLGRSADEMRGQSWYSLMHPEDLPPAANFHTHLIQAGEGLQVEVVLRLLRADLSWTWVYIRASRDSENQRISCWNAVVSPTEAAFLQKKISCEAFRSTPSSSHFTHNAPRGERPRTEARGAADEPDARGRWESEQDIYCMLGPSSSDSPASSSSPLQLGELHLLMEAQECTDSLLSSPEGSASFYSHPDAWLSGHHSPTASEPRDPPTFGDHSPLSSASSSAYGFQPCTSKARLVPDCLFASEMCESPAEGASLHPHEFDLLENPQGGGVVQLPLQELTLPPSLLPPPPAVESDQYDEQERAQISVLAQQISSLASSFSRHQNAAATPPPCDWPPSHPPPSLLLPRCEMLSDDGLVDSILDMVPVKHGGPRPPLCSLSRPTEPEAPRLPAGPLTCGGAAKELHQLHRRLHHGAPSLHSHTSCLYPDVLVSPRTLCPCPPPGGPGAETLF